MSSSWASRTTWASDGFTTGGDNVKPKLREVEGDTPIVAAFTFLGVEIATRKRKPYHANDELVQRMTHRAARLAAAGGALHDRRTIFRALAMSMWSWVHAWTTVTKTIKQRLAHPAESSMVLKPVRGRNRFLAWSALGREYNLDCQLDCQVARAVRGRLWRRRGAWPT